MTEVAATIASRPESLGDHYDVLVIGSGYGGAITAARLGVANAAAGGTLKIAVLERGEEFPTGTFPDTERKVVAALRSRVNPLGLYDLQVHKSIDVIRANGLGGTSLMNFNVAIVPDREVFLASWPRQFRDAVNEAGEGVGGLQEYYDRARRMLGANRYADDHGLKRNDVFRAIAKHAGAEVDNLEITVSTEDRVTRYGVIRKACNDNGDDATGDNTFSKNTLMTNYLPMARHFGVELFTRVEVDRLEQEDGSWRVFATRREPGSRTAAEVVVTARRVIVAAGAMGTNAILLRSAAVGLPLSKRLGQNFSGNGDNFGIAYNTDLRTDTQAWRVGAPERKQLPCGPSITAVMRFNTDSHDVRRRFTVQDLSIASPLQATFRRSLMTIAATHYRHLGTGKLDRWRKDVKWNTDGAMNHSLGFLIMVHDNSDGEIVLKKDGSVTIDWPGAPTERAYKEVDEVLRPAVEAIGGSYMLNPRWKNSLLMKEHLVTAHPMGGCLTADSVDHGVVDHRGQVFNPDGGVHDGLYVTDASVIPRAIGVNPFLTISMFAERAAEFLRADLGLPAYDPDHEGDDRA